MGVEETPLHVPHTHQHTGAHPSNSACFMNWVGGCACAPVTSKGKGNHCKSHSVPGASFWQNVGEKIRFFGLPFTQHFGSVLSVQSTDRHRLAEVHLSPPTYIHGRRFKPPLHCLHQHYNYRVFYQKHRSSLLHFWTGDLEMKTDFTFFCRTWIGIAYASGEETSTASAKVWSAQLFAEGKVELSVYTDFQ